MFIFFSAKKENAVGQAIIENEYSVWRKWTKMINFKCVCGCGGKAEIKGLGLVVF